MTDRDNYDLEITIPADIEILHMEDKVRFRGKREVLSRFVREFYRLDDLADGYLCKLGNYTLKISDYLTEDREKENWIELPAWAWGIMGSKFLEVTSELEDNPFDFNDCACVDKNPFDIGIEVTDLPIRYMEFYEDGTYEYKIVSR